MFTQNELFKLFEKLNINYYTLEHEPLFTVDDGADIKAQLKGGHSKNLFLKDKKGALFLLVAEQSTQIELKHLHKRIDSARLSFGKPELLLEVLGMTPGSVNPFALVNDGEGLCTVWLDEALLAHEYVNFHPLYNTATTTILSEDLKRFLAEIKHKPNYIDFENTQEAV